MSNSSAKKSVFDRIGASGGYSSASTTISNKSTHGFCTSFLKTGTCLLGDSCKYIHDQLNSDKSSVSKDDMRITKTITRVVDMSSTPIKSTITVSNEQRPVVVSNSTQSTRTVVESANTSMTDHSSDRRSSVSERKQSQNHSSDLKTKSSPKKKTQSSSSSSYDNRHSSNKKTRSMGSDSPVSSASDAEHSESSHKQKRKSSSSTHTSSSKHRKHDSISPRHDEEETLNDQLNRQNQLYSKSPKRTIVITERKKDEKTISKSSKTKANPDIEFLGSKKVNRDKKSMETIHQQAENTKKSIEIKREKKSPSKSLALDQQRRHSSSMNTNEKPIQIKIEETKTQVEPTELGLEVEKATPVQPSSPICVILDDDSSPDPSVEKKLTRQSSDKKANETEKTSSSSGTTSKSTKRSRDSDKNHTKEKISAEHSEAKRKRLSDEASRKTSSSNKNASDNRSTSNRSDTRRSANNPSKDESSSRKYKDKIESKTSRTSESTKERTVTSSKSHSTHDRRDTTRSSSDKKYSSHRPKKEKDLENVTDLEEHFDETILPKQTVLEAYMSMDWSSLSRDKRIPLNTQLTSRSIQNPNFIIASERLLTSEQKQELTNIQCQPLPLTYLIKQLQTKSSSSSSSQIVNSSNRRFGSSAKDMIEMRHRWFIKSIEPVQQYEFLNKEHYIAFQQAINSLLNKTSTDVPSVPIETTTADVLLS